MNLAGNPSFEDLRAMFFTSQNNGFRQVLWVSKEGDVHLEPLHPGLGVHHFDLRHAGDVKFRSEPFDCVESGASPRAAGSDDLMKLVHARLVKHWRDNYSGSAYIFLEK